MGLESHKPLLGDSFSDCVAGRIQTSPTLCCPSFSPKILTLHGPVCPWSKNSPGEAPLLLCSHWNTMNQMSWRFNSFAQDLASDETLFNYKKLSTEWQKILEAKLCLHRTIVQVDSFRRGSRWPTTDQPFQSPKVLIEPEGACTWTTHS